ncbi:hypothetical protein [Pseudomonas syringae]|uniref:hypothetical protein n=1 Tax=Pseudomonas syringae TaxID=317 RepID=UPI001E5C42A2|nr:hypothetical protein [Pseudomonas syringae]
MSIDPNYGVISGPNDRMKQEIGEIVIAHANCDPMLAALMRALTKTNETTNLVLIQQLKLKGSSMADFISAIAHKADDINPLLRERIQEVMRNYRKLSAYRNEVAHWQWNPSEPGTDAALIRNTLSKKPSDSEKVYTLENLRDIAFGLHQISGLTGTITGLIASGLPDEGVPHVMRVVDEMFEKVKRATQSVPEPAAEEQT